KSSTNRLCCRPTIVMRCRALSCLRAVRPIKRRPRPEWRDEGGRPCEGPPPQRAKAARPHTVDVSKNVKRQEATRNVTKKPPLLALASFGATATNQTTAQTKAPPNSPQVLFVQTAKNVAFKDGILTLEGVSPGTTFFS